MTLQSDAEAFDPAFWNMFLNEWQLARDFFARQSVDAVIVDAAALVYDGNTLVTATRLYQGQTTNFRRPGGGFAQVFSV